ncbi:glutamine synthetase family protein [Salinarimonas rosea]|uniref:glutamine synthetase family protein n=1 Tax=Salinarimonas rosea TaxID=552063 RepID=UPI00041F1DC3|nr:glutamine synthetase family protein [Salinarimonas rosea]
MTIDAEDLVLVCCSDIAGQVRGKGFPARDLEKRRRFGVGWTPTNIMINCLGRIPATPFGPRGDLFLAPAAETETILDFGDGSPREHWFLGDILTLEETPWECCPRSFLARALAALEAEAGLRLVASFEHEFHMAGAEARSGDSYGLGSMRSIAPFTREFIGALRANGLEPDTFLPEYGTRQYEVTLDPAPGLEAADRAVRLREICRAIARRHGFAASFSPVVTPGIVGNGVHIHFSLTDRAGDPVTFDPAGPGGMSAQTASFAAGILRHAPALCAVTAPSVLSYERLKPNSWSACWANLGVRDREATLRVCPLPAAADIDPRPRFNLEFRAADAAASPYLQLGMLVFAGLQGLREALPAPQIHDGDPGALGPEERARLGIQDLPRSLEAALAALEADEAAMGWMGETLAGAYLMHKRGEIDAMRDRSADEMVALYAEAY